MAIVGVKIAGGDVVSVLNTEREIKGHAVFTTIADGQTKAVFEIFYCENETSTGIFLENLLLEEIRPGKAGEPELEFYAEIDGDGNFSFKVVERECDKSSELQMKYDTVVEKYREKKEMKSQNTVLVGRHPYGLKKHELEKRKRITKKRGAPLFIFAVVIVLILFFIGLKFQLFSLPFFTSESIVGQRIEKLVNGIRQLIREFDEKIPLDWINIKSSKIITDEKNHKPSSVQKSEEIKEIESSTDTFLQDYAIPENKADSFLAESTIAEVIKREENDGNQERYRIYRGDTLWRITQRFYGDWRMYPKLAESNHLLDPNHIIAGDTLYLPLKINGINRFHSVEEHKDD